MQKIHITLAEIRFRTCGTMKIWILLLLVAAGSTKTFDRCELAQTLKEAGLSDYYGVSLDDWVCLAYEESRYKTDAINKRNFDDSADYGIFQINNRWWCSDGRYRSYNTCRISCRQLLNDDISDDIECAKTIVRERGLMAWVGWKTGCKDKDLSQYTAGCGV